MGIEVAGLIGYDVGFVVGWGVDGFLGFGVCGVSQTHDTRQVNSYFIFN